MKKEYFFFCNKKKKQNRSSRWKQKYCSTTLSHNPLNEQWFVCMWCVFTPIYYA